MDFGFLSLFLYWSHTAWHMVGAQQISVSQMREEHPQLKKKLYMRVEGGEFTSTKHLHANVLTCIVSLICIIQPHFTKERMRPKEAKSHALVTVPPPGKIARCSLTVTLIARIPSLGLVLTPFHDSSPISLSLVIQMQ